MGKLAVVALSVLSLLASCKKEEPAQDKPATQDQEQGAKPRDSHDPIVVPEKKDDRMYTTYFYTAGEAVIHGYAKDTKVRIVALADPETKRVPGTIWEGTVGIGETKLVKTGMGVFGLLSDKKASILVGTPSSCAVVGYFLKDEQGRFKSEHFFTQLPSSAQMGGERVIVWAYEPTEVTIRDPKTQKEIAKKKLVGAGDRLELDRDTINPLSNQVIEISSSNTAPVAVEVYYDQGFLFPATNGRGAGTDFYGFAGHLTNGSNDLDMIALGHDAHVTVTDLETKKVLLDATVPAGKIKVLQLSDKYVRVQSDETIEVMLAAYETLRDGYAEHHFATGREGGGIDNEFDMTTSAGIWMFSYFKGNEVVVTNSETGKEVYKGKLDAGVGHEIMPGGGLYHVKASRGLSVMGGANACGADYSPAAGLFAVDEAMLKMIAQITQERVQDAAARGETLTPEQAAAAPITSEEWSKHAPAAAKASGYDKMNLEEANERKAELQKQK